MLVGQLGPLELDEQELVRDRRGALLGAGEQRATGRILGVDGEAKAGVRAGRARGARRCPRARCISSARPAGVELADATPVRTKRGRPAAPRRRAAPRLPRRPCRRRGARCPTRRRRRYGRRRRRSRVSVLMAASLGRARHEAATGGARRCDRASDPQRLGQWLRVHDDQAPRRTRQHHVQEAQPSVVVADEPRPAPRRSPGRTRGP